MYKLRCFYGLSELPALSRAFFGEGEAADFFASPAWFRHLMQHFFPGPHQFRIYLLEDANGHPLLLMPLRVCQCDYSAPKARVIGSISHPENYATVSLFFAPGVSEHQAALTHLFRLLRQGDAQVPGSGVELIRLWPVEVGSEKARLIHRALRRAGYWVQVYANSYNRFERTAGVSYADYFANRSANLRYSVRRRSRALLKQGAVELILHRAVDGLDEAVAEYSSVALASWKTPESMVSDDMLELIRLAAENDCLRLGLLRLDGRVVAAQFWIVSGGVAHCARLAYCEDCKQLAVGVVLTNFMIQHVLDQDRVSYIDFGYGEEDYKGGWMKEARDYSGFLAFNPATSLGFYHGLRNILGRPVKRMAKWGIERFRRTPKETEAS